VTQFVIEEIPTTVVATVRRVVPLAELSTFFATAFDLVGQAVGAAGGHIAGPPFGWSHDTPTDSVDVSAGFPVGGDVHTPDGGIRVHERAGGSAAVGVHVGPYDELERTYAQLQAWLGDQGLTARGDMWEEYLSPPEGDPATWQTRLVTPLA
jgi:effector-binding domain-containing protein